MAARVTDKKKKKIIADYLELGSYTAVSKKNNVSRYTVTKIVQNDKNIGKKLQQKKEENTADIIGYMDEKKNKVCNIIGRGLEELDNPERFENATLVQITTAIGTLIDKWTNIGKIMTTPQADDSLSESLKNLAKELQGEVEPKNDNQRETEKNTDISVH